MKPRVKIDGVDMYEVPTTTSGEKRCAIMKGSVSIAYQTEDDDRHLTYSSGKLSLSNLFGRVNWIIATTATRVIEIIHQGVKIFSGTCSSGSVENDTKRRVLTVSFISQEKQTAEKLKNIYTVGDGKTTVVDSLKDVVDVRLYRKKDLGNITTQASQKSFYNVLEILTKGLALAGVKTLNAPVLEKLYLGGIDPVYNDGNYLKAQKALSDLDAKIAVTQNMYDRAALYKIREMIVKALDDFKKGAMNIHSWSIYELIDGLAKLYNAVWWIDPAGTFNFLPKKTMLSSQNVQAPVSTRTIKGTRKVTYANVGSGFVTLTDNAKLSASVGTNGARNPLTVELPFDLPQSRFIYYDSVEPVVVEHWEVVLPDEGGTSLINIDEKGHVSPLSIQNQANYFYYCETRGTDTVEFKSSMIGRASDVADFMQPYRRCDLSQGELNYYVTKATIDFYNETVQLAVKGYLL